MPKMQQLQVIDSITEHMVWIHPLLYTIEFQQQNWLFSKRPGMPINPALFSFATAVNYVDLVY